MDNFDYPAIGQRIKQLRKRKGLNQTELAQMLKKSLRTVQKYETGEIEVSIAVVNQIADLLDSTPDLYPRLRIQYNADQNAFRRDGLSL